MCAWRDWGRIGWSVVVVADEVEREGMCDGGKVGKGRGRNVG